VAPYGALPIELQVAEIVGSLDERRSFACGSICDAHTVGCGAEMGLLSQTASDLALFDRQETIMSKWSDCSG